MTVKQIITEYLKAHGYDGLCSHGLCGCDIGDLAPCQCDASHCVPAYKNPDGVCYTTEKPSVSQQPGNDTQDAGGE